MFNLIIGEDKANKEAATKKGKQDHPNPQKKDYFLKT